MQMLGKRMFKKLCPYDCCKDFNPHNRKDAKLAKKLAKTRERRALDRRLRSMLD